MERDLVEEEYLQRGGGGVTTEEEEEKTQGQREEVAQGHVMYVHVSALVRILMYT